MRSLLLGRFLDRTPLDHPVDVVRTCFLSGLSYLIFGAACSSMAADQPRIDVAIHKAKQYLLSQSKTSAAGSLACYALVKAGVDKQHPDVQKMVLEVLSKCRNDAYSPAVHHIYEAGVDALLLEAVDREQYKPQLELIAAHLVAQQRPHGAWYYPMNAGGGTDYGDTSISQYGVLGLWACSRAGVDIPTSTWEKAAQWLIRTQHRDGGFGYHPANPATQPMAAMDSTRSMTAAGTGSLLIIRLVLFGDRDFDDDVKPPAAGRRFGVLERLPDEKEPKNTKPRVRTAPTMSVKSIDDAIKEGVRWTSQAFGTEERMVSGWTTYYYYGIERVAALLDVEMLGTHDWYSEGSEVLLRMQSPGGDWSDSAGAVPSTALAVLFLTKATAGALNKPKRTPVIGGGLLVGGRGLPNNLDALQVKEGEVKTRKLQGPVDGLLAELEKSSGAKVEAAQAAVVEAVQLDHPEELIGQVDRLKRLATDKRLEVRRTAMWALGRTGNVSVAPFLIRGLADADEAVAREASLALTILSRRPNGLGPSIDPTDGLSESATDEERAAHLSQWRKGSVKAWNDWYLKVRPYNERDDQNVLKPKS